MAEETTEETTEETAEQAVIEDDGEVSWEEAEEPEEPDPKGPYLLHEYGSQAEIDAFERAKEEAYQEGIEFAREESRAQAQAQAELAPPAEGPGRDWANTAGYLEHLERSHKALEHKLAETASPEAWEAQQAVIKILTDVNETMRKDLEYAVERVEVLGTELAHERIQSEFTESELARAHGRAVDVDAALKTGKVEVVCSICKRKQSNGDG